MKILLILALITAFTTSKLNATEHTAHPAETLVQDAPVTTPITSPDWFKQSFLEFPEDLAEAKAAGKKGIIIYFGQQQCPYCQYLLEINWGKYKDIIKYTQRYFDVIGLDIWGELPVIAPEGRKMTERSYSEWKKARFTPTLLFYNLQGKEIFRLKGYYPPYQFRAALDYVVGDYYQNMNFANYLQQANPPDTFDMEGVSYHPLFTSPPYLLDRRHFNSPHLLAVFFEQGLCHACDIMHTHHLQNPEILTLLETMEIVQLDIRKNTPVITPNGKQLTAKTWAQQRNIFYTPSLLFFDGQGKEIILIDSIVGLRRLTQVLTYLTTQAYLEIPFQTWLTEKRHPNKN